MKERMPQRMRNFCMVGMEVVLASLKFVLLVFRLPLGAEGWVEAA
jgi:hypothetical protein